MGQPAPVTRRAITTAAAVVHILVIAIVTAAALVLAVTGKIPGDVALAVIGGFAGVGQSVGAAAVIVAARAGNNNRPPAV